VSSVLSSCLVYYAHRVRGDRAAPEPGQPEVEEKPATRRRCSASWARLISKVFHVDPLTCAKCGGKLEIIAYLHDQVSISKILEHLDLGPSETAKPPPALPSLPIPPVPVRAAEAIAFFHARLPTAAPPVGARMPGRGRRWSPGQARRSPSLPAVRRNGGSR